MKNQYFGDIHDFKKYTLLHWFMNDSDKKLLIAWYLTEDDKIKKDGNKKILSEECYHALAEFLKNNNKKDVKVIEKRSDFIGKHVGFFSEYLKSERKNWFEKLKNKAQKFDIVFMDPDNGIKFDNSDSVKHVLMDEIKEIWKMGKSIIIYQHFPMINHEAVMAGYVYKLFKELKNIKKPFIAIVFSSDVMYIFILQGKDKYLFENVMENIKKCGKNFLDIFEFSTENIKS